MSFPSFTLVALIAVAVTGAWSSPIAPNTIHAVSSLPGEPDPSSRKFDLYSGFITVNESHGRNLFYWHATADVSASSVPAADVPLAFWFTGGPGCSSSMAFLGENGPWLVQPDETLKRNAGAWNRGQAPVHMVWVDSPAGVGFSYSKVQSDYDGVGDYETRMDAAEFVRRFVQLFNYTGKTVWVTGESYGGHYVPWLTLTLAQGNEAGLKPHIVQGGMAVGNAWTNAELDNRGAVYDWHSHALISDEVNAGMNANCNFSVIGPLSERNIDAVLAAKQADAEACSQWTQEAMKSFARVNIYDIYADVCLSSGSENAATRLVRSLAELGPGVTPFHLDLFQHKLRVQGQIPDADPCLNQHIAKYLNTQTVQSTIGVDSEWYSCSPVVQYSRASLLSSMLPVYEELFQRKLRLLVYSGDVDGIVPITGTRAWMRTLNMTTVEAWRPWFDSDQQTGGFVTEYEHLTFASVRDAGHMAPYTQPQRSLDLISRFIYNQRV